eukprot:CAMPEP_0206126598 /NCGR_PEP_ID=MMETSP1472-20131121/23027_1 /ASSEMBLY_ACC=CAM_ASM_001108 /TAXON_ID=41880 /ORGANISM="Pycnococcus provasolii, Strain RCC251" /LENGTH=63 /DNA_ID=CAMNT_0053517625 /DNA_START=67 /DNA_END=258 /DNA_ORIENTATION=-
MKRCKICGSVMSFNSFLSALGSVISSMQALPVETASGGGVVVPAAAVDAAAWRPPRGPTFGLG